MRWITMNELWIHRNGYFKKTKHGKFSEKQTFLIYVCVRKKCYFFRKFGVPCFLETPVLRFALLPYYQRNIDDVTTFKLKIEIAKARIFFNIVNIKYFINWFYLKLLICFNIHLLISLVNLSIFTLRNVLRGGSNGKRIL